MTQKLYYRDTKKQTTKYTQTTNEQLTKMKLSVSL